jgi:hypothetical protein
MSSFGAPLDEVWIGSHGSRGSNSMRESKGRSSSSKKQQQQRERFESSNPTVGRCDDDDQLDMVMNMRSNSCGSPEIKSKSKPRRKCPPAPPSSPRRPARCNQNNDAPPQWIPINTPPKTPKATVDEPDYFDGVGASWGNAYGDSVAPFGFWDAEGTPQTRSFEPVNSPPQPEKSLYFGEAPAFLSALPQFAPDDSIGGPPQIPVIKAENSDFVSNGDDDFANDDEDEDDDDDEDDEYADPPIKRNITNDVSSTTQIISGIKEPLDGATFAADMAVYVASGVLLIFVMEQFVQMGLRMR